MRLRIWPLTLVLALIGGASLAMAQAPHYIQKNGVTYVESRQVVQRQVPVTRMEQREQTVYSQRVATETQESTRTFYTPVTEYQCQPRMHGRWNPFIQPYYTYHYVPVRRWQSQQEIVRTPVTRTTLVPEKRIVQVPVTRYELAETEYVTRTPVSSGVPRTIVSGGQPPLSGVGGVARLESDPPRTGWRPATGSVRRY